MPGCPKVTAKGERQRAKGLGFPLALSHLPFAGYNSEFMPVKVYMRLYLIALQFLTIIPLPFAVRCEERDLGRSMALFPLVGLFLGFLLVGVNYILTPWLPRPVVDLLLIVVLSAVTGALHLDG